MMPAARGEQWVIELDAASDSSRVADYLERRRAQLATLRSALEAGDFEALWLAAHRMHGAGGAYGVPRISELGAALEVSSFQRDVPRIRTDLDRLEAYLACVAIVTGDT